MIDEIVKYYKKGDYESAFKLAYSEATSGSHEAMTIVGEYYSKGIGVNRSVSKAEEWFRAGAESKDAWSVFSLARFYELQERFREAVEVYGTDEMQKYGPALFRYAQLLEHGKLPSELINGTSYEYFQKAADRGHLLAEFMRVKKMIEKEPIGIRKIHMKLNYYVFFIKSIIYAAKYHKEECVRF